MKLNEVTKKQYEIYHSTYTSAVGAAKAYAEAAGYEISDDTWFREVNNGPRKPEEGKTNSITLELSKGGTPSKKALHLQVYNRGNAIKNNYELNAYIS